MNPSRVEQFAEACLPAMLTAFNEQGYHLLPMQTREDWALSTTLAMIERLERYGLDAVEYYHTNTIGCVFARACVTLGIPHTRAAIISFLDSEA